eukprot:GDKH01027923.1.p1 GENE.GDKH01027923.1~~GDKH01027923.1.p1  ORF type:complete len:203 (-),score=27.73 GDKH01027923.1:174-782(-)
MTQPDATNTMTCRNHGCLQQYTDDTNSDEACRFHEGWPLFHDGGKRWSCCKAESWEWEAFMKLPGCKVGRHSNVAKPKPGQQTAAVAAPAPQKIDPVPMPQRISTGAPTVPATVAPVVAKKMKPLLTDAGRYKCCHVSCNKEFEPDENEDGACKFHSGKPMFRDLRKEWTCCGAASTDWDDFVALPPCQTGRHEPKMVEAKE